MFEIKKNKKNKSAVILSSEAGVKISGASVKPVVNDGAKTQYYSAKKDLYGHSLRSTLKMTEKALSFLSRCCAFANQGISAPASCREAHKRRFLFNLIRRSLEKFFKKNFRDDHFCFGFAKVTALAITFTLATTTESWAINCYGVEFPNCTGCYDVANGSLASNCSSCPKGFYRSQSSFCTICPMGAYCEGGEENGNVTYCPRGTYTKQAGGTSSEACVACPEGSTSKWDRGGNCVKQAINGNCDYGWYLNTSYGNECWMCANGFTCPGGSTPFNNTSCPRGTYGVDNSCIQCPKGTFQRYTGKSYCDGCPAGAYCDSVGATSYKICPNGYSSDGGATECTTCPAGTYGRNGSRCQACQNGLVSAEGAESCISNCPKGTIKDGSACILLPGCGNFEDGSCTECVDGYLTNSEGTCTPASDCKNGLHADNGACVENDDVNCNTQEGNKCIACKIGYLEKNGSCVTSCGAGYKQIENFCNRIRYTPAEAAQVLRDDNTNEVTITFKK